MANDEPPYLTVGTDVSAKYKGAFCEAKIKKVNRVVKCKVTFKNNLGSYVLTHDLIKGSLRIGAEVEAKHPEKNQFLEAVINKLQDYSQYTVVFDDGDETTLRRTSLCLKSGRHFAESPTLDQFPLTNPEHFGTPVIGAGKYKRKRRSTMNSSIDYESSDEDSFPKKLKAIRGKEKDPDLGKVVAVDFGDRRKKDSWYPGLIVPHPAQSTIKISKEEHLIRSFKDGKYYQVPKRDTREFLKESLPKVENNSLKIAVDKASLYLEKGELPPNWDKVLFMGLELPSADEDSQDSDTDSSDDEPSEEKDRFVAQLYKFMDERGTPINKAPAVSNRDLNLYKLFKIMHKLGGFNKVTNQNKWKVVYCKMGLPLSNPNGPNQIKCAYKRYLQSFEDFYRKLGCTMVNNTRSTRGRHRSDRSLSIITRTREREASSPKGRNSKDSKDKIVADKKTEDKQIVDKKEIKKEDTLKVDDRLKSPEKKRIEKPRTDDKDDKKKKEERPRLVRSQSMNKDKKEMSPKEEDKKDSKPEKARTREDARKEKSETPEKKGTRSSIKIEKEKEESLKDKKDQSPKSKEKKEEKSPKDIKDEKPKEKKDEKPLKERKSLKDKKAEEKPKVEESSKMDKKDEKQNREKRESSKEEKSRGKKEELSKSEERSPVKKKLDRLAKDKKEEKIPVRARRENKSPLPDCKKPDNGDLKKVKEEKKVDAEDKKEEIAKEKPGPRLRDRKDDSMLSEYEEDISVGEDEEKDAAFHDSYEKKPSGPEGAKDNDEPPNKGRKRSFKAADKDDFYSLLSDSDEETFLNEFDKDPKIELGDRVKVKYGRGRLKKVYDAKVLKIQNDGPEKRYFVHYNGWNNRYDEWVRRNFIVWVNSNKQKPENSAKTSVQTNKKVDKGRPPGPILSKPARKNSTSSNTSSVSISRSTRGDRKSTQSSPLSCGPHRKKRTRKKIRQIGLTDTSQDSDSDLDDEEDVGDADVEDNTNPHNDSCFKEELFSDDEEKEKMEDVKRDDIKELEKAISIEETAENSKEPFFAPVKKEPVEVVEAESAPSKAQDIKNGISNVLKNPKANNVEKEMEIKDLGKEIPSEAVKEKTSKVEAKSDTEKEMPTNIKDNAALKIIPESEKQHEKSIFEGVSKVSAASKIIIPAVDPKTIKGIIALSPKLSSLSVADQKNKDAFKSSLAQVSATKPDVKNALSFAGLIQIGSFEKNVPRISSADSLLKPEQCKVSLGASPLRVEKNIDAESVAKGPSIFGKIDKVVSAFSVNNVLASPKLIETSKSEDHPVPKINPGVFSFLKFSEDKEKLKNLKSLDSSFKVILKEAPKDKASLKFDDLTKKVLVSESSEKKLEPVIFKHGIIPFKFCTGQSEAPPEKIKDSFDLLMESTKTAESKKVETKDPISSVQAPVSNAPEDRFMPDKVFPKSQALSVDNLCIKPKPSETVDLSKTIPGIIERLKKDVVNDLKVTDSPPPQKEELSFNFLKSSQDAGKSLSRSESSSSLRICEDMSDTNDSNNDSKEVASEVVPPSVESPNLLSDNAVHCPSENLKPEPLADEVHEAAVKEAPSAPIKEKESVNRFEESVVMDSPDKPAILPSIEKEKDVQLESVSKSEEGVKSNTPLEEKVEKEPLQLKVEPDPEVKDSHSSTDSCSETTEKVNDVTENIAETKIESPSLSKNEKDSLFDDLLKIKNSTSCSLNSVIMWNQDSKSALSSDEKSTTISEEKDPKDTPSSESDNVPLVSIAEDIPKDETILPKKVDVAHTGVKDTKSEPEGAENLGESSSFLTSKKESKKKKLGKKLKKFGINRLEESKFKDGRTKSKKRFKLEIEDGERSKDHDLKVKSKKFKKNKNKKRLVKNDESLGEHKKGDLDDDHKDISEKSKRKRKSDKKFFKSGLKGDFESRLELKKKKGKKNRDKLSGEKKDFLEKKVKKKKKIHVEENQDTDSEKEMPKPLEKRKKKDRKKYKAKDSSSSDDAAEKYFKDQSKILNLPSSSALLRQDSKSDDPDMSFLLCEEKVPASPVGIGNNSDDTSNSSSIENNGVNADDILPLPNVCPLNDNIGSLGSLGKHGIDTSTVLDNTPPTTPSSTESLLSSSPSHERDSFSMNYPESTQSGKESGEGESDLYRVNANRVISRGSEEYNAAQTLAFAVCKTVDEKPKEAPAHNFLKRQKSELEESSPVKRRKKSKRVRRSSESGKSPRHKSSLSRLSKAESCCEDSSGASPAASSSPPYSSALNFSRSPHRMPGSSEGFSKYSYYVPLHEKDPEKRITLLQEKMTALRKEYMELKAKVIAIDHKRRKARKKIRETSAANANPTAQSGDGPNCS